MEGFRKDFKEKNPNNKQVSVVSPVSPTRNSVSRAGHWSLPPPPWAEQSRGRTTEEQPRGASMQGSSARSRRVALGGLVAPMGSPREGASSRTAAVVVAAPLRKLFLGRWYRHFSLHLGR
ncbi:uncharacterized protein LOC124664996 [Lolium rigidum]|uniref:uncharacterized protein LOC124664996 n=1 Tax=Lolium rigidum TaxID=89674 RepID=UPI001F5CA9A6|nr:uncharacterized protein LOC124664996 [Lolium rigidum]